MGLVEVHILGQKYIIRGEASSEYIQQLADYVDQRLKEVYSGSPQITPLKAAILTALNISDELHTLRNEYNCITNNIRNIEDKADSIIRLFE
jgi:cell division protein ZapA